MDIELPPVRELPNQRLRVAEYRMTTCEGELSEYQRNRLAEMRAELARRFGHNWRLFN